MLVCCEEVFAEEGFGGFVTKHFPDGVDGGSSVADESLHVGAVLFHFGGTIHIACRGEKVKVSAGHFTGQL